MRLDLVGLHESGEEQQRYVAEPVILGKRRCDIGASHTRHIDVADDHIGLDVAGELEAGFAPVRGEYRESAGELEPQLQKRQGVWVIVDGEQAEGQARSIFREREQRGQRKCTISHEARLSPSMTSTFRDHFSSSSADYARFRPRYPRALFEWVASQSPGRERAWDVATGSGQAALALADDFALVVATDASRAQLAAAASHARVRYVRSTAEASGLSTRSMDAIVAAQAVHWFDRAAFFAEARRVARPRALVAVWTYGNPTVAPDVDALLASFYGDIVGPYWPPERRLIENLYRDVELPFTPVAVPELSLELPMTLDAFGGYIGTWSAVQRYREAEKRDPLPDFIASVAAAWGDPASVKQTRWPLAIRAGRN